MSLNYDYTGAEAYCKNLGLHWLGDSFVVESDKDAHDLGMTQAQVERMMEHHLWNVHFLFTPKNYSYLSRVKIALWFLFK